MENAVIFKIELRWETGGFAKASNFISKMRKKENLSLEEVQGITTIRYSLKNFSYRAIAEYVAQNREHFKRILRPENLTVSREYRFYYCLWIENESLRDLIDLQYDCLIKKFFKSEDIVSVLDGSMDLYFKASHYLYSVSSSDDDLYNRIFYKQPGDEAGRIKLQRLQIKNAGRFKDFMPLQYFSEDQKTFKEELQQVISRQNIQKALKGENKDSIVSPVLKTGLDILRNAVGDITEEKAGQIADMLCQGDIFTFLLFAYSFMDKNFWKKNTIEVIWKHYDRLKECAAGCEQLIENVVHHSTAKSGCVSIRLHERNSAYLKGRYCLEGAKGKYVEILITDYAGINTYGNLADNFRMTQGTDVLGGVQPVDFLLSESNNRKNTAGRKSLITYLYQPENIGKHIGLKIFRKIVEDNNGIFGFYSHRNHKPDQGENYQFSEYSQELCMPGTGYTVLFPLKLNELNKAGIRRAEIGIDYNINLTGRVREFVNGYACSKISFTEEEMHYDSQADKEKRIAQIAEKISLDRYSDDGKRRIIYISAGAWNDREAEYLCKAVLIAPDEADIPDLVFYDCTKGFLHEFQRTMAVYFSMPEFAETYKNREFTVAIYTKEPVECCFMIPGHYHKTILANRINCYLGSEYDGWNWLAPYHELYHNEKEESGNIPPYDILFEINSGGSRQTIFELYTKQILETDIQGEGFGCKIENTHMRLGSTIHIGSFYEAELLFNNRLFVSRFAYLLVKDILSSKEFIKAEKVTLYSYALYSEALIVEVMDILKEMCSHKDIDYAIFEREADHREFSHIDRIRYSNYAEIEAAGKEYFQNRKIICIVPINSTLKTHEKMLNQFLENNERTCAENIILNYALILIGSLGNNKYWKINEEEKTFHSIELNINPIPKYFIANKVEYYEANCCKLCFPDQLMAERPLVEVNAASTIPNQAIGLYGSENSETLSYDKIKYEEEQLSVLKDSFIYAHTQRGENHFLYYFKTDELFLKQKEKITEWLDKISKMIHIDMNEYHILFCPSHFSNAGFMEYINRIVFHEAAMVIRVDVDKEYRSNICAKYSNLALLIRLLDEGKSGVVKLYYVDDSIITGRTFFRAKSLVSSIINLYRKKGKNTDIRVFEKVFVLLDRNSEQSRLQYVEYRDSQCSDKELLQNSFFAFRTVQISSMRNHGDSCTLCQLQRESDILHRSSATKQMAEYWEGENGKFEVRHLKDKEEELRIQSRRDTGEVSGEETSTSDMGEKSFRRMFCCHMATVALSAGKHGNRKDRAVKHLLELLITDYNGRKQEQGQGQETAFEYFLSYLKILSRPFLVFDKTVKEVVFDVLLVLAEDLLRGRSDENSKIWEGADKNYLNQNEERMQAVLDIVRDDFKKEQRLDLMKVLMKQLTEMKGNYFIRSQNIAAITKFASEYTDSERESLYDRFLQQTKKLLGVSSDTSKSAWFSNEVHGKEKRLGLPEHVLGRLLIENTRAYYDGLNKLYKNKDVTSLKEELSKAQYRDFCSVLSDIGLYDVRTKRVPKEKEDEVKAGVDLLTLCKKSAESKGHELLDRKIEAICHEIVGLMKKILCAEEVKLLLECPMECDRWEDHIRTKFNELAEEFEGGQVQDELELPRIELHNRKEYLVIANSNKVDGFDDWFIEGAEIEVAERLRDYRSHADEPQRIEGLYIDEKHAYLIWEIDNSNSGHVNQRRLLVYAKLREVTFPGSWYKIRNLLCLSSTLNESIFNEEVIDYLFELMLADEKGMLYGLDRTLTHTKSDVRSAQYYAVESGENENTDEYRSFVLTLLSDLQVSKVYRESMKEEFYRMNVALHAYPFSTIFSTLQEGRTYAVVDPLDLSRYVYVYLHFPEAGQCRKGEYRLRKEDKFLSYAVASGANDVCLLLLALIMNAAGVNRGFRNKDEKHDRADKIVVCLTKTQDGNLRISNKCGDNVNSDKNINAGLRYPPKKNDGISLWSVSRYVKSIISILLENKISNVKRELDDLCIKEDILENVNGLKAMVEKFLGEEYDVKAGISEDGRYFYMDIPILAEKYVELSDCLRKRESV
ncbi:MAG: hypothetical protein HDR15_11055 [Lachnospiraceae bacterium]|nr:hypothetical protein [Lachnospiraceae bacterium]